MDISIDDTHRGAGFDLPYLGQFLLKFVKIMRIMLALPLFGVYNSDGESRLDHGRRVRKERM